MKKIKLWITLITGILLLTACSSEDVKNAQNAAENGIQSGMDAAEDGIQSGMDAAENGLRSGIDAAENGMEAAENGIQNGMDDAEDGIQSGMDAAEGGARAAADTAGDLAQGVRKLWTSLTGGTAADGEGPAAEDGMVQAERPVPEKFEMISGFSTKLYDMEEARIANIRLAISKIDGMLLYPGDVFSFNTAVGERSEQAGFREARALWKTEPTREIGGGVCQLSTTIYQAAQRAGLEITERHPHQKAVNYVEEGLDACVDYGVFDLAFRNNTDRVLKLKGSCDDVYVHITLEREVK